MTTDSQPAPRAGGLPPEFSGSRGRDARGRARPLFPAGNTPAFVGLLLFLSLLVARAAGSANAAQVFVFGRELRWGCLFKIIYGLPCPGCGLTRGVLLTLHGELRDAFAVNLAAPLVVFGLAAVAVTLVAFTVYGRARTPLAAGLFARRARQAFRLYGALVAAVLLANWLAELFVAPA